MALLLKNMKGDEKEGDLNRKYDLCARTAYVAISVDEDQPGIMVAINNIARDYLGYSRAEALGHNVKVIMPKVFGYLHDNNVKRYISSVEHKS